MIHGISKITQAITDSVIVVSNRSGTCGLIGDAWPKINFEEVLLISNAPWLIASFAGTHGAFNGHEKFKRSVFGCADRNLLSNNTATYARSVSDLCQAGSG